MAAAALIISGLVFNIYAILINPGLWLIPLQKIFVAVGAVLVGTGSVIGYTQSYEPFTPSRAGIVPITVIIFTALLFSINLKRSGGLNITTDLLQQFLLIGSLGAPVGATIKQQRQQLFYIEVAIIVLFITLSIILWPGSFTTTPPLPIVVSLLFAGFTTILGYKLAKN